MTKQIRIENADTSDHKVTVEVWQKIGNGEPDVMVDSFGLDYPTSMITKPVFDSQYLIIKEEKSAE